MDSEHDSAKKIEEAMQTRARGSPVPFRNDGAKAPFGRGQMRGLPLSRLKATQRLPPQSPTSLRSKLSRVWRRSARMRCAPFKKAIALQILHE